MGQSELRAGVAVLTEEPCGRRIPKDPDALLLPAEAAYLCGLGPRTLESYRYRGGGIPYIQISLRAVRYRRGDVDAWIHSRRRKSTSDPGPDAAVQVP